jgi:hypothetical protein
MGEGEGEGMGEDRSITHSYSTENSIHFSTLDSPENRHERCDSMFLKIVSIVIGNCHIV